jgi:NAD(P)-dependent dehydrogenase (short-subunit alcohol dehydrogenase family)
MLLRSKSAVVTGATGAIGLGIARALASKAGDVPSIAINLSATFHAIGAALPDMEACHWGRIVSTSSAHSIVASPFKAAYVSAKHGIAGLIRPWPSNWQRTPPPRTASVPAMCNAVGRETES